MTAELPLGNTLNIKFRWKYPDSVPSYCVHEIIWWPKGVTVKCTPPVETSATTLELFVETYDHNSSVQSALKTDTMTLNITPHVNPSLESDLVDITYDWQADLD